MTKTTDFGELIGKCILALAVIAVIGLGIYDMPRLAASFKELANPPAPPPLTAEQVEISEKLRLCHELPRWCIGGFMRFASSDNIIHLSPLSASGHLRENEHLFQARAAAPEKSARYIVMLVIPGDPEWEATALKYMRQFNPELG